MRYFLTGEDGNRYGPADEDVLRDWATQGRLTPHTVLEPESGGPTIVAGNMPTLQFPPATRPYSPGQTTQPYNSPYSQPYGSSQQQPFFLRPPSASWSAWEVPTAWGLGVLSALGIFCGLTPCLASLGIIVSIIGLVQGRKTLAPLLLCIAMLIMQFLVLRGAMGGGDLSV